MRERRRCFVVALSLGLILAGFATSAAAVDSFYEGKTIRILVGYSPGGSFDSYSRGLARHMRKHIPGSPTIIVDNMTGAGGLILANHLYKVARPDGLTIGHFGASLIMGQLLGQKGIEFDGRRFEWVGSPVGDTNVCVLTKASGIANVDGWRVSKAGVKIGADSPGSNLYDNPQIYKTALGLPIHIVAGYKGTPEIRLAAEQGEVAGGCVGWTTIKPFWGQKIEAGEMAIMFQAAPKPHADLPRVPLAIDLAKTTDGRDLIRVGIVEPGTILRTWSLPPGTPKDRVEVLRRAFLETMKDPAFLAEMEKVKLDVDPVPGEEVEKIVQGFFTLSPSFIARLKEVLVVR